MIILGKAHSLPTHSGWLLGGLDIISTTTGLVGVSALSAVMSVTTEDSGEELGEDTGDQSSCERPQWTQQAVEPVVTCNRCC